MSLLLQEDRLTQLDVILCDIEEKLADIHSTIDDINTKTDNILQTFRNEFKEIVKKINTQNGVM